MASHLGNVTLRQLRSVSALAASGSITGAARLLNLTQPAITLQLRKLQEIVELPLFQRTGDGMVLTEAGRHLLQLAERIEASILDCGRTLDMMSGRSGGRVSIGAVSTAKYFIPFTIAAFSRQHPKVQVSLSIGNRMQIMQELRRYDLDFAIMGRPPPDVAVERHLIGDHPHVIVAPAHHRLAGRKDLVIRDLTDEVFLTREMGSGTRSLMERLFEEQDFVPTIGMEFDSNETIKQAVIAGLGIAFISAHTVASELSDRRLVMLDLEGLPVVRQWYVMRRSDKVLLPPAQAAFDFMAAQAPSLLPSGLPTTADATSAPPVA